MYAPGRSKMIRGVHSTRTLWRDLLFWRLHVGVGMVREMLNQHCPRMRARQCISYLTSTVIIVDAWQSADQYQTHVQSTTRYP
jgi:hypothetical protein